MGRIRQSCFCIPCWDPTTGRIRLVTDDRKECNDTTMHPRANVHHGGWGPDTRVCGSCAARNRLSQVCITFAFVCWGCRSSPKQKYTSHLKVRG